MAPVAATYDSRRGEHRTCELILPLILLLVGAVLVLLLRGLLAPLLLVLTVIASFFASLGAAWLLFDHVLDFPALDSGVLLLAFVFLVALGSTTTSSWSPGPGRTPRRTAPATACCRRCGSPAA